MSTKTTFKRISLVLVSVMGLGLISINSASASVIGTPTVTPANGTATIVKSDSTGAASLDVRFFTDTDSTGGHAMIIDSAVVTVTAGTKPDGAASYATSNIRMTALDTSTSSGAASVLYGKDGTVTAAWSTPFGTDSALASVAQGVIAPGASAGYANGKFGFFLDTAMARTAGTYTIDYVVKFYEKSVLASTKTVAGTLNIVVSDGSLAAAGAVSASATSTAVMKEGSSYPAGHNAVDSTIAVVNTPSATVASAVIRITQLTAAGLPSRESITVTTNIGNIGTTSAATGKSVVFKADTDGIDDIGIFADGTGGIATITIKTTSVTFANKQVTFYGGTVAKIDAVMLANTLGGSAQNIILAKAYDAGNNQVLGDTVVYAYSSNTSVVNTGTSPAGTACTYSAAYGGQLCSLAGSSNGTATFTLRNASTSSASTVASTATLSVTVNTNAAAAIKLALNKSTYAPGEVAYLSVWAVDAAGNAVGNGTYTNLLATGGITSTVAVGNNSDATTSVSPALAVRQKAVDGIDSLENVKVYKVYMPYTGGDISFEATGGSLLPTSGQVKVTVKASVTDNGAAALAAVTALASQVSAFITKINAQITTLTDLVMKIQKKVKA